MINFRVEVILVQHDVKDETIFFFLIEKSEPQMGLEPTTLRDLVGCSNHWATGDSMVSEGQFVGLDWNRIAWRF